MKPWNVRVMREGQGIHIGQVAESTEVLARCAALSHYGLSDDEVEADGSRVRTTALYPEEDFEVSIAI